jgi:hypothetical protein
MVTAIGPWREAILAAAPEANHYATLTLSGEADSFFPTKVSMTNLDLQNNTGLLSFRRMTVN